MKGIYPQKCKPEIVTGFIKMVTDQLGNRVCFVRLNGQMGVGFGMTDLTAQINAYREAIRIVRRVR